MKRYEIKGKEKLKRREKNLKNNKQLLATE